MSNKLILILLCILLSNCERKRRYEYFQLNGDGVLKIFDTKYEFEGNEILYLTNSYAEIYEEFPSSSYYVIYNDKIYSVGIYSMCEEEYKNREYQFVKNVETDTTIDLKECNILLSPFVDFTLNEGEISRYNYHHFIQLKDKYFSLSLNDTAYIFERYNLNSTQRTVISVTKNLEFDFIFTKILINNNTYIKDLQSTDTIYKVFFSNIEEDDIFLAKENLQNTGYVNLQTIQEIKQSNR